MRAPVRRSRPRPEGPRGFHSLAVLLLVLGLVASLAPILPVAAAPAGLPDVQRDRGAASTFPAPVRVAVVGSFQAALGCPADYDPSCGLTELDETGGGTWAATLAVPPGEYAFRVVAASDVERSLGRGGDPDGADLSLSVPADAAGAYFAYDAGTGEITGEPVGQRATLVTDFGQEVALAPAPGGGYEATFDAQPGAYGFQVLLDDQPVGQDAINLDAPSRVSVAVDDAGNVVGLGTVEGTSLAVAKVDAAGVPLPGACFAVLDGGALAGQACDGDDGAADGQTALRVPDGLGPGGYDLVETLTPEGQEAAEAQTVDLGPGQFAAEAVASSPGGEAAGDEATEPAEETPEEGSPDAEEAGDQEPEPEQEQDQQQAAGAPGRVAVRSVDGEGEPLGGSCFALVELGYELCDDDADGTVLFEGVPEGSFTLSQTAAPEGYEANPDAPVEVGPEGGRLRVTHEAPGDAGDGIAPIGQVEPEGTEAAPAQTTGASAAINVAVRDREGNAIPGSCLALTPRDDPDGEVAEVCDGEDGADDGEVAFAVVPGRYRLAATLVPSGFRAPEPEGIEVGDGESAALDVTLRGEAEPAEAGEDEGDGDPGDGDATAEVTEEPTAEPTEEGDEGDPQAEGPGRLVVLVEDDEGEPVGETCFAVEGDGDGISFPEICDQGNDGRLNIPDLPAGEYRVRQLRTADGLDVEAEERTVEIEPGEDTELRVVNWPEGVEEAETPTPAPTEESTAEATEEPTEEATGADAETGAVRIVARDAAGEPAPLGCYVVLGPEQYEVCDGDRDDARPAEGEVLREGIAPGEYQVFESRVPPGAEPAAAAEEIEVVAGETAEVGFGGEVGDAGDGDVEVEQPAILAPDAGEVLVLIADGAGRPIAGACVALAGPSSVGPVCDGGDGDDEGDDGAVRLVDVVPGDYAVSVEAPEGYQAPAARDATIVGGETARLEVELAEAVERGSLLVALETAGQPVAGACVELVGEASVGPVCDVAVRGWRAPAAQEAGPGQDGDATGGRILVEDLPAGDYELVLSNLPPEVATPEPRGVTVEGGQTVEIAVELAPALGTLVILVEDEAGDPVGGTCFTLDGPALFEDICDQGDDGRLNIPEIPAGEYAVRQTAGDPAFEPGEEETVDVPAGGEEELTIVNRALAEPTAEATATLTPEPTATPEPTEAAEPAATATAEPTEEALEPAPAPETPVEASGTLVLSAVGGDGAPVGGACYRLTDAAGTVAAELCDGGPSDGSADAGVVAVVGLAPGLYLAEQIRAAEGYAAAEGREVEVAAGAETVEEFAGEAVEPELGSVLLQAVDEAGEAIAGQCFLLDADGQEIGTFCDDGAEDADPAPGSLEIGGLPLGAYQAVPVVEGDQGQDAAPEVDAEGQVVGAQRTLERRGFTLGGGQRPVVRIIVRRQRPEEGDLLIAKRDERDRPLPGACFALVDGDGDEVVELCDNEGEDGDGNEGQIRFDAVPNGDYTLTETRAPDGYVAGTDQALTITGGRVQRLTVANEPLPSTASLGVSTVDADGAALPGACYALLRGSAQIGPVCDGDDGAAGDGRTIFADLEGGAYLLRQTRAPSPDYTAAREQALLIEAGAEQDVEVANAARPGSLLVFKADEAGEALGGACFALVRGDETVAYELCDGDASDGAPAEGLVLLQGVAAGDYLARETRAPAGYAISADQAVSVAANRRVELRFEDVPLPPPPQRGDLIVSKTDAEGQPLAGACFALLQDGVVVAGPRCDGGDGAEDGTIGFVGVGVGDYALREVRRPSADYEPIADRDVSIELNLTTEVTVENVLRPGRVLLRKTDVDGDPLAGACFNLEGDGQEATCTEVDGTLAFEGLAPGSYRLVETRAPEGYLAAAPVEGVVVRPGATTTVDVVDELAPPPPDTGAIQILKFYCPAGDGGEGTEIVDSSDSGSGRLARTAGCERGDARFRVVAASGEGGPGEVSTGTDGRYQTTLLAGAYELTELAPDLPGEATEAVSVAVNQMTTVVVLNFVAPPAPAPAAIDLLKYTCDPGFEGTVFADFAAGCLAEENLTNSVLFRLSGELAARATTGDGGSQGVTGFAGLPAGDYLLREEPPTAAQSVAAFCGLDPNNPDLRSTQTGIELSLAAGQRTTCYWFNVPDDLSETTGAIVVHKYGCALASAQAAPIGFDWYDECSPQGAGVRFSLALLAGDERAALGTAAIDGDGLVRFNRLDPGVYALQEVGGTWCRAESDSVDARGNVVVRAGQRANVWIFNCLGTTEPPNTGAGPLAAGGASGGGAAGLVGVIGFVWPLVGPTIRAVLRRLR